MICAGTSRLQERLYHCLGDHRHWNNLGLSIIAEGVEVQQQLAFLKESGCQTFQGYLHSPPLPIEEFVSHLSSK
jgi:EAL domain-containing protein (putative c-di-GMP-specific phosphodiesterase class I)